MRARRTKLGTTKRVTILYARVSTDDQAERGVSLADQEARLRAYGAAMGWSDEVQVVADAGESAKSLQRPGIASVLASARRGEVGRIVVAKLDRLTRSVRDLAELLDLCVKHDVALVSLAEHLDSSSAAGRLVVNMLGVVSQWEREAIGERTAAALAHKRTRREAYSPTPIGFRREGELLVDDVVEQQILAEAVRLDRAGESYRAIGRVLTERGLKPRRGSVWHASSVRAMLRSQMVAERFPIAS